MKTPLRILAGLFVLGGFACLGLYYSHPTQGDGALTWEAPLVKKSLMTFAYKVYGNPTAQQGRNFLSKIIFRNNGSGPVHDFSISYQIPDYIPWTTPETHEEIQPGQTLVMLYYPQLPSKVTQLANQTTVTLETKIHWSDKTGSSREEVLRSNVELRGVNEIEYTDLPMNEVLNWYDQFATAPFCAAMVTPNDPVVQEFVAQVTERMGGTTAGIDGGRDEVIRTMKAVYDYMCETGMRYTSDSGVPETLGDIARTVQTVRLPRDVIITNQGLCIELALLWASVMEHLGLHATVVFVPHHAFTLVMSPSGNDYIPIECTGITGRAVRSATALSFVDAVARAQNEMNEDSAKIFVNVQQYQQQGFRPPELPGIDVDKIKNILSQRGAHKTVAQVAPTPQPAPTGQPNTQPPSTQDQTKNETGERPVREGFFRYTSPGNWVAVDIPAHWTRVENSPIGGMIFTAQDMQTTIGVNVFRFTKLNSTEGALRTLQQEFKAIGVKLEYKKIAGNDPDHDVVTYQGRAISGSGTNEWVGLFQVTRGGVLGFVIGDNQKVHTQNKELKEAIYDSVYFGS